MCVGRLINILVLFLLQNLNWIERYSTMKIGRFFFVWVYIQHTVQATGFSRRTDLRVRKELRETGTLSSPQRGQYKPLDDFDEFVIRNNVQEFNTHRHQLPTINNLLSVLKSDIMSTIHQN